MKMDLDKTMKEIDESIEPSDSLHTRQLIVDLWQSIYALKNYLELEKQRTLRKSKGDN